MTFSSTTRASSQIISVRVSSPTSSDGSSPSTLGTVLCTRAGVVQMLEQGSGGSIINVTSINAVHPVSEGLSHYTTSKHAVWGFSKSLALDHCETSS